jgi:hypothetical protein
MTPTDSQVYESYLPLYDTIPENWEEARGFIVEQLKRISIAINTREIGYYINDQILTGKQFIPVTEDPTQYRDVFRIVIPTGPLVIGTNTIAHGLPFDENFTLVDMWVAATNTTTFTASVITDDHVTMNVTDVVIDSLAAYTEGFLIIEMVLQN